MTEPHKHPLDQATTFEGNANARIAKTTPEYQNFVGPFGGVTAAQVMASVLEHPERQGSPAALTINYLGPIADGTFSIQPRLVRNNRSNQHWIIEVSQDDAMVCSATMICASRPDSYQHEERNCPEIPARETLPATDTSAFTPWVNQYDMHFASGALTGQVVEQTPSRSLLWLADKPRRALDFLSLTALCDTFFPRIMTRKQSLIKAGTISLTIYFHCNEHTLAELRSSWVIGEADANKYYGGHFDQSAYIWSEDGTLLATSTQLVYFKE